MRAWMVVLRSAKDEQDATFAERKATLLTPFLPPTRR